VRDHFPRLRLRQAIMHRPVEVVSDRRTLAGSNQGAHRHQTSIPGRKTGTQLKIAEQDISAILHDSGSNITELLFNARCAFCFGHLVERKQPW